MAGEKDFLVKRKSYNVVCYLGSKDTIKYEDQKDREAN